MSTILSPQNLDLSSVKDKEGVLAGGPDKSAANVTLVLMICLLGIAVFTGALNNSLFTTTGYVLAITAPYFIFKFLLDTKRWTGYIAIICLSVASFFIYYQTNQQAVFLLLFLVTGVAILYQNSRLIWIPTLIGVSGTVLFFLIKDQNQTEVSMDLILYYHFFLLVFSAFSHFISQTLHAAKSQAALLSAEVAETHFKTGSNIKYAKEIATGNFDAQYDPNGDELGLSLLEMSKSLRNAAEEERQRTWQIEGIAKLHEMIRQNNKDFEELCSQIITFLVKYTEANQGGLFIKNDDEKDPLLELKACYAYSRKKFLQKEVKIREGLLGQAFLEEDMVYLIEVPKNYFFITSGLGNADPKALIIVPLKMEENVVGVFEIASFKEFPQYVRDFLLKASESIASAVSSMKANEHTSILLRNSQELAEELRAQEEEVRQNMEELHSTQEDLNRKNIEMQRAEEELKESQIFLNKVLNSIPAPIGVKNRNHEIILMNSAYKERVMPSQFKVPAQAIQYDGSIAETQLDTFREEDEQVFGSGSSTREEKVLQKEDGIKSYFLSTKAVFLNNKGEEFLISVFTDISDRKESEDALAMERLMFNSLMDTFPDRINFKDKKGKYLRVNKTKASRHGLDDPALIIGKSDFDYFKEEHARKAFAEELSIMESRKAIIDLEEKLTYPDGSFAWGSTSKMPLVDEKGEVIGTYGITRDTTERKKVEATITSLQVILSRLSEVSPILLYKIGKEKLFTDVSGSGIEVMGLDANKIIGSKAGQLLPYETNVKDKNEEEVVFTHQGSTNGQKWTFKHFLYADRNIEGGYIGFAVRI